MKVKKHKLFLIAGMLWTLAGLMVTRIGVTALKVYHPAWTVVGAGSVYLLFYREIFSKMVRKHETRLITHKKDRLPLYMFFDKKSYILMAVMMSGGTVLRKSGVLPVGFFSFFYTGLGLALFSCGLRFLYLVGKHRDK